MTEKKEIDIKKVNEVAGILGNWLSHNVDWYKKKGIDLNERDDKNKLVHNAKNIAGVIGDMSGIVENISNLEQKVKREQEEDEDMRGNRKKSLFEDGI